MFGTSGRHERGALETIVSTYERPLLVYVTRITGNASIAEDIVQEVFIKLSGQWRGPMEPGPQISAWLYKVAHNGAIDALRRERRRGVARMLGLVPGVLPPVLDKADELGQGHQDGV